MLVIHSIGFFIECGFICVVDMDTRRRFLESFIVNDGTRAALQCCLRLNTYFGSIFDSVLRIRVNIFFNETSGKEYRFGFVTIQWYYNAGISNWLWPRVCLTLWEFTAEFSSYQIDIENNIKISDHIYISIKILSNHTDIYFSGWVKFMITCVYVDVPSFQKHTILYPSRSVFL